MNLFASLVSVIVYFKKFDNFHLIHLIVKKLDVFNFHPATSKTWTRILEHVDSEKPGPWKTWTLKNLNPEKPGPWKAWTLKSLDPEIPGS